MKKPSKKNAGKEIRGWAVVSSNGEIVSSSVMSLDDEQPEFRDQGYLIFSDKKEAESNNCDGVVKPCRIILD